VQPAPQLDLSLAYLYKQKGKHIEREDKGEKKENGGSTLPDGKCKTKKKMRGRNK
jgi:hypothetical protein